MVLRFIILICCINLYLVASYAQTLSDELVFEERVFDFGEIKFDVIVGNPPYLGSSMQNKSQKEDMSFVFNELDNYKKLESFDLGRLKMT